MSKHFVCTPNLGPTKISPISAGLSVIGPLFQNNVIKSFLFLQAIVMHGNMVDFEELYYISIQQA